MTANQGTAVRDDEWRKGWPIVLCAFLGMGLAAAPSYSLGVFMKPLADQFGWSRTELAGASFIMGITSAFLSPFIGRLADRIGARPLVLLGTTFGCAGFCGLGIIQGSIWSYWALFLVTATGIAVASPMIWSIGVATRFDRHRGGALGLALNGINVYGALTPPIATALIMALGWRGAYFALGAGLFLLSVPFALLFFFDAKAIAGQARKNETPTTGPTGGLTFAEALRTRQFWIMGIALIVTAGCIVGIIVNLIPLLTDHGMAPATAAGAASAISIAAMITGAGSGFLFDHVPVPRMAAIIFAFPTLGCLLLINVTGGFLGGLIAAITVGATAGAQVNLIAYFSGRYFGMKAYGSIYGLLFGMYAIGQGPTAILVSAVHDHFGSYAPAFVVMAIAFAVSGAAMLFIGPPLHHEPRRE